MMIGLRILSVGCVLGMLAACGGGGGPVLQERNDVDPSGDSSSGESAPVGADIPDDPITELFGGADPEDEPVEESQLEETLAEREEPTIALTGLALISASGGRVIVLREGVYDTETDVHTLNGESLVFTSNIPGAFADSSAYVQVDGPGIVGIATDAGAMPDEGTATFRGGAAGLVIVGSGGVELRNGRSVVEIDFGESLASATLSDFTFVSLVSETLTDAPFDSMSLTDATISGTGFSGGTLSTAGGDSVASIVGANAAFQAQGQFFGVDDTTAGPAEVGGLIFTQGDAGTIFGSFIAD